MPDDRPIHVAIVDYALGNLYSVKHACAQAGLEATITSEKSAIESADAVILPGVGAYADAMATLHRFDLVTVLQDLARSKTPLIGICLGFQLLMTESYEFGRHKGLGIIDGPVVRLNDPKEGSRILKVPQIGWNRVWKTRPPMPDSDVWQDTLLARVPDGEYMYFVHSYVVQPEDPSVSVATSRYGHIEFCSCLRHRNVFACQFHPERSGQQGLHVYRNLAALLLRRVGEIS